jgi:superfamily I DNA/RNA helicase
MFELEPLLADMRGSASGRDKREMRKLISAYEAAWARLQHEIPGSAKSKEDEDFENALNAWLVFHRAMLIGELVPFAYKYLRDNPAAPELSKYSHILVDEYQDLNKAEQEVAAQLATNGELIIVGDDDQSIYTFKNAHRVGIIEFSKSHPGTSDHTMDLCQRCPRLVVSIANSLISKNRSRPAPPRMLNPIAANGDGVIESLHFALLSEELEYLGHRIQDFIKGGVPPGQIIVLCQSRDYIRGLYESLRKFGVPCEFCYQESQFDEEGASEKMAVLSLVGDPEDRVALRYLMGMGSADWRANQWAKVRELAEKEGLAPFQILAEMHAGRRDSKGVKNVADRFSAIFAQIEGLKVLSGRDLLDAWIPAGTCTELRSLAERVVAKDTTCSAKKLADEVREIVTEPDIPEVVPDVRLMSLHKSKGLSANVVIIAGCVEGILPRQVQPGTTAAAAEELIEESRRLFFVGITRVKASPKEGRPGHLLITASREVPTAIAMKGIAVAGDGSFGHKRTLTSRFLNDLGPDFPKPTAPKVAGTAPIP